MITSTSTPHYRLTYYMRQQQRRGMKAPMFFLIMLSEWFLLLPAVLIVFLLLPYHPTSSFSTSTSTSTTSTLTSKHRIIQTSFKLHNENHHHPSSTNLQVEIQAALDFASLCGKLKSTQRTGWVQSYIPHVESVADHSWRMAILSCFLLLHYNNDNGDDGDNDNEKSPNTTSLNITKCVKMALVHDLAEAIVGDIAPSDNIPPQVKHDLESQAMDTIAMTLGTVSKQARSQLQSLYDEYEERASEEAIVVKDLDLLDMILQAEEYETMYPWINLEEFFEGTTPDRFQNEWIRSIASEVHRKRKDRRDGVIRMQEEIKKEEKEGEKDEEKVLLQGKVKHTEIQGADSRLMNQLSNLDHDFLERFCQSRPDIPQANVRDVLLALRDFQ